jgi:hypothetical protein
MKHNSYTFDLNALSETQGGGPTVEDVYSMRELPDSEKGRNFF